MSASNADSNPARGPWILRMLRSVIRFMSTDLGRPAKSSRPDAVDAEDNAQPRPGRGKAQDKSRTAPVGRPQQAVTGMTQREIEEMKLILEQLDEALGKDPSIRPRVRHMAALERALREMGWAALRDMPIEHLQTAKNQFEALITNWSPRGLAVLRSRMAIEILERTRPKGDGFYGAADRPSDFTAGGRVEVREGTDSVFMEYQQAFGGPVEPLPPIEREPQEPSLSTKAVALGKLAVELAMGDRRSAAAQHADFAPTQPHQRTDEVWLDTVPMSAAERSALRLPPAPRELQMISVQ